MQTMTWDDHDIFDGWGSYPDTIQNCPVFQGCFQAAKRFYLLFQQHTTAERAYRETDLFGHRYKVVQFITEAARLSTFQTFVCWFWQCTTEFVHFGGGYAYSVMNHKTKHTDCSLHNHGSFCTVHSMLHQALTLVSLNQLFVQVFVSVSHQATQRFNSLMLLKITCLYNEACLADALHWRLSRLSGSQKKPR